MGTCSRVGAANLEIITLIALCVQFYSCLFQQQSLLQDYLRITTYQRAILVNEDDFRGKVGHMLSQRSPPKFA